MVYTIFNPLKKPASPFTGAPMTTAFSSIKPPTNPASPFTVQAKPMLTPTSTGFRGTPYVPPTNPTVAKPTTAPITATGTPKPAVPLLEQSTGLTQEQVMKNLATAGYSGTQTGQNTPQAPQTPAIGAESPSTPVSSAEEAYKNALKATPEEQKAQEEIDLLAESAKTGYQNTKGQAIPLQFITGQLKTQEERAMGLMEPLERKLARLQAARTTSLEASKFALERADKAVAGEATAKNTAFDQSLRTRTADQTDAKFAEDKRQFGLEYALKQRELAAKETDTAASAAAASKSELKNTALSSAKDLLERFTSGRGTSAVGKSNALGSFGYGLIPGTERADFVKNFDNLKSLLSLDNAKLLKGQGQITEAERKMLADAATELDRNQSEAQFQTTLGKIITALTGSGATEGGRPQTMTLNGQVLTLQSDGTYE